MISHRLDYAFLAAVVFTCFACSDLPAETRPLLPSLTASSPAEQPPRAGAHRSVAAWSERARWSRSYPEGTTRVSAAISESGGFRLRHEEYRVPAGKDAKRRWDLARARLPDGSLLFSNSVGAHAPRRFHGNGGFNQWNLLNLRGTPPESDKTVSFLRPSRCVAVESFRGEGWAGALMILERPLTDECTVRTTLRVHRLAAHPHLYLQVYVDPDGARVDSLSIGGYPLTPPPAYINVRNRPRTAKFLTRRRWVWAAGHDWNMHEREQEHALSIGDTDPGGIFWYNRQACELAGMKAVFLPEQVDRISAAGTYGVSATLRMNGPVVRLALKEWASWRGWQPVREEFVERVPALMGELRRVRFARPIEDLLTQAQRREIETLLGSSALPEEPLAGLRAVLTRYDQALGDLHEVPVRDTVQRLRAEQELVLRKAAVVEKLRPLRAAWLRRGGMFEE